MDREESTTRTPFIRTSADLGNGSCGFTITVTLTLFLYIPTQRGEVSSVNAIGCPSWSSKGDTRGLAFLPGSPSAGPSCTKQTNNNNILRYKSRPLNERATHNEAKQGVHLFSTQWIWDFWRHITQKLLHSHCVALCEKLAPKHTHTAAQAIKQTSRPRSRGSVCNSFGAHTTHAKFCFFPCYLENACQPPSTQKRSSVQANRFSLNVKPTKFTTQASMHDTNRKHSKDKTSHCTYIAVHVAHRQELFSVFLCGIS